MIFQTTAIIILITFYIFYFAKIILQSRNSIKTNQLGIGNKPKRVLIIERFTCMATVTVCIVEIISIFVVKSYLMMGFRIVGIIIGFIAVIIFAIAVITMRDCWRVGIPKEKTSLVTSGIYSLSRNPAFVSFDLLYISICLMFFNISLVVVSLWAMVMLHFQILEEEKHMHRMFGGEYDAYRGRTRRYLGRKYS